MTFIFLQYNYMSDKNFEKTIKKVKELYGKLNYYDLYFGSIVLNIIIIICVFLLLSYSIAKSESEIIVNNWANERCKPHIIPIAGFITKPQDKTAFEYTQENFNYCTEEIMSGVVGTSIQPLSHITVMLTNLSNVIETSIQGVRKMFDRIRSVIQVAVNNVMLRLVNIMVPLQHMILGSQDIMNKMQGSATVIMYTTVGSYSTFQSLMGIIAKFIVDILIAMAIIIAVLLAIPFTAGAAGPLMAIFLLISIPFGMLLQFMDEYLNIRGYSIPRIKCFDKDTRLKMEDGTEKKITDISVGDVLTGRNVVNGTVCVETKGSTMYSLNDVCVSDTHIVKYGDKWIPVSQHPSSVKCDTYNEPYLYCLNTSNKTIVVNDTIFTDWDEIYGTDIDEVRNRNPDKNLNNLQSFHTNLDGGFKDTTQVKLVSGEYRNIKDVAIGDTLENGEIVYGTVTINGKTLCEQFKFILEENVFEGGPNLIVCGSEKPFSTLDHSDKTKIERNHDKLYHLLTDRQTFVVNNVTFYDYNACIDIFLEKNKKNYYL